MKRLALLMVVALTSCAPVLSNLQHDPATLTRQGEDVVFTNPADTTAEGVTVFLAGATSVTGAQCGPVRSGTGCIVGDVPAHKSYRLHAPGAAVTGNSLHYRPDSNRPVLTELTQGD